MSVALNPGVSPIFVSPLTGDTNVPPVGNDPGWALSGVVDPNLILFCDNLVNPPIEGVAAQHKPGHPPTPLPLKTEKEKEEEEKKKKKEEEEKKEEKKEHHGLFGRKHGD